MSSRSDNHNRQEKNERRKNSLKASNTGRIPKLNKKKFQDAEADRSAMYEGMTPYEHYMQETRKRRTGRLIFWIIFVELIILLCWIVYLLTPKEDPEIQELLEKDIHIEYETETDLVYEIPPAVPRPNIDTQLLTINDWSRPGIKVDSIDKIVIHYLGNPKTTAQENHDYFESLKDLQDTYMSANYVVGLEGEIIQCVPDGEVAWASNKANYYSISIENCHEDETGKFNDATYWSDVHLVAWLTEKYDLGRDDIIRHYDVTGKDCPKYFVEHEDAWEQFLDNVMTYREECEAERDAKIAELTAASTSTPDVDELREYLDSLEQTTEAEAETTDSSLWDVLKKKAEQVAE